MTTDPETRHTESTTRRERAVAKEETHPWPPSATTVWVFIVAAFMLGGPLTWMAVTR
ncbi:MAG TPA: hypothetical protein VFR87_11160 [Nocardioidaceae bacterium]|nr:hypothetical protein [Nocardioidaceae bacterium]